MERTKDWCNRLWRTWFRSRFNFLNAANGVTIVALGDTFQERVDDLAKKLKDEKGIDVPADKRFVGLDAYKQVIDSGVDVVIVATPPVFRPVHFQYATEKGKHSFLEKPICVDPVGYRTIMATAKQAAAKNLCVVTGTHAITNAVMSSLTRRSWKD